jgi:hypothetical protein
MLLDNHKNDAISFAVAEIGLPVDRSACRYCFFEPNKKERNGCMNARANSTDYEQMVLNLPRSLLVHKPRGFWVVAEVRPPSGRSDELLFAGKTRLHPALLPEIVTYLLHSFGRLHETNRIFLTQDVFET